MEVGRHSRAVRTFFIVALGLLFLILAVLLVVAMGATRPEVSVTLALTLAWTVGLTASVTLLARALWNANPRLQIAGGVVGLGALIALAMFSWRVVIRPEIEIFTCRDCPRSTEQVGLVFGLNVEPGLELECGEGQVRRVGSFRRGEPPSRSGGAREVLEDGNIESRVREAADSLRTYHAGELGRSLEAIVLIGSTDPDAIQQRYLGLPHPENHSLALQRAILVQNRLLSELRPFRPHIIVLDGSRLNTNNLLLSRLVRMDESGREVTTQREVFVCGIWKQARRAG